jgi:endoglucanase
MIEGFFPKNKKARELLPLRVDRVNHQPPQIVDASDRPFQAQGIAISGSFHMENFLQQFPGTESTMRTTMADVLGDERAGVFFDSMYNSLITEPDVLFIKHTLGANAVRIPINYNNFADKTQPGAFSQAQIQKLSQTIDLFGEHGMYSLIDFHALPKGQNYDWHSDNDTGIAGLWNSPDARLAAHTFAGTIADSFKDNPHVLGYELMNEPYIRSWDLYNTVHQEMFDAVRANDQDHIIFIDGDMHGTQASGIAITGSNWVISGHIYNKALIEPGQYPGTGEDGVTRNIGHYRKEIARQDALVYAREHDIPAAITEFGAIRGDKQYDTSHVRAAGDLMTIFNEQNLSWFYWIYKGYVMGVMTPAPDSPYSLRTRPEKQTDVQGDSIRQKQVEYAQQFDLPADRITEMIEQSFRLEHCKIDGLLVDLFKGNTSSTLENVS